MPPRIDLNIAVVEKSDNRLCLSFLDPRRMNKAVKRCHFLLPPLVSNLPEATLCSKCNAKYGFLMLRFDVESSKLYTWGQV